MEQDETLKVGVIGNIWNKKTIDKNELAAKGIKLSLKERLACGVKERINKNASGINIEIKKQALKDGGSEPMEEDQENENVNITVKEDD